MPRATPKPRCTKDLHRRPLWLHPPAPIPHLRQAPPQDAASRAQHRRRPSTVTPRLGAAGHASATKPLAPPPGATASRRRRSSAPSAAKLACAAAFPFTATKRRAASPQHRCRRAAPCSVPRRTAPRVAPLPQHGLRPGRRPARRPRTPLLHRAPPLRPPAEAAAAPLLASSRAPPCSPSPAASISFPFAGATLAAQPSRSSRFPHSPPARSSIHPAKLPRPAANHRPPPFSPPLAPLRAAVCRLLPGHSSPDAKLRPDAPSLRRRSLPHRAAALPSLRRHRAVVLLPTAGASHLPSSPPVPPPSSRRRPSSKRKILCSSQLRLHTIPQFPYPFSLFI